MRLLFLKLLMPNAGNSISRVRQSWLLAHAFGSRSKRLGAYLLDIVIALCR